MKRISIKKEILVIVLLVVTILAIGSNVLATGTSGSPVQIPVINTTTNPSNEQTEGTNITNQTANTIAPTTNTTGSTYQNNTTLPQTGDASDYAIFLVITVSILIAIYAYKKVREYNI